MKKSAFLLLLIIVQYTYSQCSEPSTIPYSIDVENAAVPNLPNCMSTNYATFASVLVFQSILGPVEGFNGKLFSYDTATDSPGGGAMQATVGASLYTYDIQFEQGVEYEVSYRYGNGDASKSINAFGVRLEQPANNFYFDITNHQNITGATVTNFTSQPFTVPATGIYRFEFIVQSLGNQGLFYLDDISVHEAGAMNIKENILPDSSAYPNPTTGKITIRSNDYIDFIEIYNLSGQLISNKLVKSFSQEMDINDFAGGIYMVRLHSENKEKTLKIYKQ